MSLILKAKKKGLIFSPAIFYKSSGIVGPPVLTSQTTASWINNSSTTQTTGSTTIPTGSPLVVFSFEIVGTFTGNPTFTVTPNVGTANQTCTIATIQRTVSPTTGIAYCVLDGTAVTATSVTVTVIWSTSVFSGSNCHIWTIPVAGLASTTPTGASSLNAGPGTTGTVSINTSSGGFIVAAAASLNITSDIGSFSGTETFTTRVAAAANGVENTQADTNNTVIGTNASSTVTATYTQTGIIGLSAASWR